MLDYLAVGIDPDRSTIFTHSAVPALNQLLVPFLSLISVAELNRNPTVKEEISQSRQASVSGLMFTYPVHQAADILFCKANLVPVGQDQLPHLEVTRMVARRFNRRYGRLFPEPEALLSTAPLLLGTDGTKMSKSRGNAIALAASADETARLIRGAKTDAGRHITYDPTLGRGLQPGPAGRAVSRPRSAPGRPGHRWPGSGRLKGLVTEAVNEYLAPVRAAAPSSPKTAATSAGSCATATSGPTPSPRPPSARSVPR